MHQKKKAGSPVSRARTAAFMAAAVAALVVRPIAAAETPLRPYIVVGDGIPASLTGTNGQPERGRAIVTNRQEGLCLLCHTGPFPDQKLQGTLAPDLAGTGARLTEAQLRLRLVDSTRVNAETIMPAYYRVDGLSNVAETFRGKPILTAEQIEDVVAYLSTLRE
jgi:sulfur-oxidizing protein SoxX